MITHVLTPLAGHPHNRVKRTLTDCLVRMLEHVWLPKLRAAAVDVLLNLSGQGIPQAHEYLHNAACGGNTLTWQQEVSRAAAAAVAAASTTPLVS